MVRIFCRLCSRKFESAAALESAGGALFQQMLEHMKNDHIEQARDLAITIETVHRLMAAYLLLEHVEIPPDETELLEWVEKAEEELAAVFGFTLKDAELADDRDAAVNDDANVPG